MKNKQYLYSIFHLTHSTVIFEKCKKYYLLEKFYNFFKSANVFVGQLSYKVLITTILYNQNELSMFVLYERNRENDFARNIIV